MQIGNIWSTLKTQIPWTHPRHPEVFGVECCMSIRIFQSSRVDTNRLRTTDYPFPSSLQCKSSSFSFSFYAKAQDKVQELEVRKCKAFKARNFPKGHKKRNTLDI